MRQAAHRFAARIDKPEHSKSLTIDQKRVQEATLLYSHGRQVSFALPRSGGLQFLTGDVAQHCVTARIGFLCMARWGPCGEQD
jgi:hypothetical protein